MNRRSAKNRLTLRQVISSTLAAAFGVQSGKALQRDFSQGTAIQFIVAGIVFTILLVLAIVILVHWVMGPKG